jgi:peptide/nickel transport system substrate-binding protein
MLRYLGALLFVVLLLSSFPAAFGHGLGYDITPSVLIDGRQVAVDATLSPSYIEGVEEGSPVFTVRTVEPATNSTIPDIDYRVAVEHGSEVFLDQRFSSPDGYVLALLVPDETATQAQINGQASGAQRVQVSQENPAQIRSRMMTDGGLYHVAVTVEKTSRGLQLAEDRTFDLYVSISKTSQFSVETPQGPQEMSVKTYYADVNDFVYDNGTITFAMPFDWRQEYVSQVNLVHMEVQFPKEVEGLQGNGYRGTINGKELGAESVLIDDYSVEEDRIVHFVLGSNNLSSLARTVRGDTMDFALISAERPKFPLDIMSTTEKYLWQLSWGPEVIETGVPTTFVMNVQDTQTADLVRNSSFDLVVEKDGADVYRQRLSSGQGTFSYEYTFGQAGTYRVAAENINNENESAQIDIVVLQGDGAAPAPAPQQQPSGCLIATAAFGSELTPQVQFLRGFRDNYILQSQSGSAFMGAFNSVYYSFSPQVADYERQQPWLQSVVKAGLYPLFGILLASEKAFSAAGGGELGTILAGVSASALIGAIYLSPAAVVVGRKRVTARVLIIALAASAGSLAATVAALYAGPGVGLSLSTAAFVVASAATAALAIAWAAGRLR